MAIQSLDNIAYEILELYRVNRVDDSDIDLRLIKERIRTWRTILLKQYFTGVRSVEQIYVQDLGCVDIEKIDPVECPEVTSTDYIFKTVDKVPQPIELRGNLMFTRIGPINKVAINFDYINYNQIQYTSFNRFTSNIIKSFYRNDYLYFYTDSKKCVDHLKLIEQVNVQGIFQDPEEVYDIVKTDTTLCFDESVVYPISDDIKNKIIDIVTKEMLNKHRMPEDKINDGDNMNLNVGK